MPRGPSCFIWSSQIPAPTHPLTWLCWVQDTETVRFAEVTGQQTYTRGGQGQGVQRPIGTLISQHHRTYGVYLGGIGRDSSRGANPGLQTGAHITVPNMPMDPRVAVGKEDATSNMAPPPSAAPTQQ